MSQSLRFQGAASLEELILRHAIGEDIRGVLESRRIRSHDDPDSGERYLYQRVRDEEARARRRDRGVTITAKEGQRLLKLPEGASYLGFLLRERIG